MSIVQHMSLGLKNSFPVQGRNAVLIRELWCAFVGPWFAVLCTSQKAQTHSLCRRQGMAGGHSVGPGKAPAGAG